MHRIVFVVMFLTVLAASSAKAAMGLVGTISDNTSISWGAFLAAYSTVRGGWKPAPGLTTADKLKAIVRAMAVVTK